MPSTLNPELHLFDAGMFIGALLMGDPRHEEARQIVEAARRGEVPACTTSGILSEVYAGLTWVHATPPHSPEEAARAVAALVQPPSSIRVLPDDGLQTTLRTIAMAAACGLTARNVHDARHAAIALEAGVNSVFTYDPDDWRRFELFGLSIAGPFSTLQALGTSP